MIAVWITQQVLKRKPNVEEKRQSYYPEDFYHGYNKKAPNTKNEIEEEDVQDVEKAVPRPRPRPRKTDSESLPTRPETLYSPTRPNSTLLLDEFVAPLFDNSSNNHSNSNLLKNSSHNSHEGHAN
ncbi:hypothetical protein E3Q22_01857 [Wallemia mellicola]|nr:hypothetical protein E3Q24_00932 [Wallemia mellicola]TIB77180.1 hypothetical protein E3Q23_01444 [Wallemia mellicola]TIB80549.1 hypothetical protein E3Q22_01857 [Wallemia mellicola]TIB86664.1 hypothetical protein E3Q21_01618 [Wallemia mellicola]TIB89609.1 hypothetical protein E3Q20_01582 [Wallemia mellicola]